MLTHVGRLLSAWRMSMLALLGLALLLGCAQQVCAQTTPPDPANSPRPENVAAVVVDGKPLFVMHGVRSYPAAERAALVRKNIIAAAEDDAIAVTDIRTVESTDRTQIYAGNQLLLAVLDFDGQSEGVDRKLLAATLTRKIAQAIAQYRTDRSRPVMIRHVALALAATVAAALALWVIVSLSRWANGLVERRIHRGLQVLEDKAHRLIRAEQVWTVFAGLLGAARFLLIVVLILLYLNMVLGLFPWTRPASLALFDLVLNPLRSLWQGFLSAVPDLAFLVVLFVVVRFIIKLARRFFDGVSRGHIRLQNFDPDWALPTFKILRLLLIALALVVAYPYIPGSDSNAFKGVSLFLGVLFSLGSSSFIANMIAGISMTYRGAFKQGDLVKIGEAIGVVDEIKVMTTRIRTAKNEIAVIPNSSILNTSIVNYSTLARSDGLALHTEISVGYDVPWRDIESMLLLAVARTEGLKAEPKPFVLHTALDHFTAKYQVNAYCDEPQRMLGLYSALHANIQDVFNEHGVPLLSPNYTQLLP